MWTLAGNHTKMFDFNVDLHKEITVWALAANHTVYYRTSYATDQNATSLLVSEKETRKEMMSAAVLSQKKVKV
jgi:hypothetical protein